MLAPTRTTDAVTLVSPFDVAIDYAACSDAFDAYCSADVPDAATLLYLPGADPVRWTLRPLNQRELATAEEDASRYVIGADGRPTKVTNPGEYAYQLLRWALVEVAGLDGWEPKRERYYSGTPLTMACVEGVDHNTVAFLGGRVRLWSVLGEAKKKRSGSLATPPNGTSPTPAASGPSTAPGAATTHPSASS